MTVRLQDEAPLILTARMDDGSFARLDGLRRLHFPPERNLVPAHITLFHKLPAERADEILASVARAAAGSRELPARVARLRHLGQGVAYEVEAPGLVELRAGLANVFELWLGRQDRAAFRPHVTVQNKADRSEADRLHASLLARFEPFPLALTGFLLWRYRGGPWEEEAFLPFGTGPS